MSHGEVRDDLQDRRALGACALEERPAGGDVVEEAIEEDARAFGVRGGRDLRLPPPSTATFVPKVPFSPVEVVREKDETLAMDASASPLNPKVTTVSRSPTARILLVACLKTERAASSGLIPEPSSRTRMREVPPSPSSTSTCEGPASREFSTSSLTTEAGRSTTSPAATCWATLGSRTRMFTLFSSSA